MKNSVFILVSLTLVLMLFASCNKNLTALPGAVTVPDQPKGDRQLLIPSLDLIVCTKTDFYPEPGQAKSYRLKFNAWECGGKLPTASYVGMLSQTEVCGLDESFEVIQPWEGDGPGMTFWAMGGCGSLATTSPSKLQVVFRALPDGKTGRNGGFVSSQTESGPRAIVCEKNDFNPPAVAPLTYSKVTFTAGECGGELPTAGYRGALAKTEVCGTELSLRAIDPSPQVDAGIDFYTRNGCSGGVSPSRLQVVYWKSDDKDSLRTCHKTDIPLSGALLTTFDQVAMPFNLDYTAAECGGELPDSSAVGVLSQLDTCGSEASGILTQPTDTTAPRISFWHMRECGFVPPNGVQSVTVAADLKLLFFPR